MLIFGINKVASVEIHKNGAIFLKSESVPTVPSKSVHLFQLSFISLGFDGMD